MKHILFLIIFLQIQISQAYYDSCIDSLKSAASTQCGVNGSNSFARFTVVKHDSYSMAYALCVFPDYTDYEIVIGSCGIPLDVELKDEQNDIDQENSCSKGSIVKVESQVLEERIPMPGLGFDLFYSSMRVSGRKVEDQIKIAATAMSPISDSTNVTRVKYNNQITTYSVDDQPNQKIDFDLASMTNSQTLESSVLVEIDTIEENISNAIPFTRFVPMGNLRAFHLGVGGWTPTILHWYDPVRRILNYGDGRIQKFATKAKILSGNLIEIPDQNDEVVYYFNLEGRHQFTKTAKTGQVIQQFTYNNLKLLTKIDLTHGRQIHFNRNSQGELTQIVSHNGDIFQIDLDATGYLKKVIYPNSKFYQLTHTSGGLLTEFKTPRGDMNRFFYDTYGRLIKDELPGYGFWELVKNLDKSVTQSSEMGRVSQYSSVVQELNQTLTSTSPASVQTTQTISASYVQFQKGTDQGSTYFNDDPRFGDKLKYVSSNSFNGLYQSLYKQITLSDPNDVYSIQDWTETITDSFGSTQINYDSNLKKYTVQSPQNRMQNIWIDQYERPIQNQQGTNLATQFIYSNEKLTQIQQGSRTTTLNYNPKGNLSSVVNPLQQSTSYVYDNIHRLVGVIFPDLRQIQYQYDDNNQITSITTPSNKTHYFSYGSDLLNNNYTAPNLGANIPSSTQYFYNLDRQLTEIKKIDQSSILFNYGASTGTLESIVYGTDTYLFTFNPNTNRYSNLVSPDGITVERNYDLGDISYETTTVPGGLSFYFQKNKNGGRVQYDNVSNYSTYPNSQINYSYNADGLLSASGDLVITYDADHPRIETTALDLVTDHWSYNSYGELTGYTAKYDGQAIYSYTLVRDALSRITQKTETLNAVTNVWDYTYDVSGRLTEVKLNNQVRSLYQYDANGNRIGGHVNGTTTTATYDDQDRLLQMNLNQYINNANGEMIQRVHGLTNATLSLTYNPFGYVKSITKNSDTKIYLLDSMNRRIKVSKNNQFQKYFVYQDELRLAAELDQQLNIAKRFVYGTKSHVPDYFIAGTEKYRIISDNLGSPRLVIRVSDGQVMQRMNHD